MSVQETMNQKYSELCQQLGSLSYQRSILDAQIAEISAAIKTLNNLAPIMRKMELDLKAANAAQDVDGETKTDSKAG